MNIVLIGMPACGKTTIAKTLSAKIKFENIDADKYLEKKENRIIKNIFSENGEEVFRNLEEKYIKELSEMDRIIISTGGGVIKRENNIVNLKKNGKIIFIDRSIDDIMKENHENRPLLQNIQNVIKLYDERYELYRKYADITVKNDSTLNLLLDKIMTYLEQEKIIWKY